MRLVSVLAAISIALNSDALCLGAQATSARPENHFAEQALSLPEVSSKHLDRLIAVLDRSFERLFGNFSPQRAWAFAGPDPEFIVFNRPEPPERERPSARLSTKSGKSNDNDVELSESESVAEGLARKTIQLYDELEAAGKSADLADILDRLMALRWHAELLVGQIPEVSREAAAGRSQRLGRAIDQKSKHFQEATNRRDERALGALNAEAQTLLKERIHVQFANAERELRQNHRPIALSSLLGLAKSFWRLRIEFFWTRVRLFRRLNLGDFLTLDGIAALEGYLTPGRWLNEPIERKENRAILVDRNRRIWGDRRVVVRYKDMPTFLRAQYKVLQKEFSAAVDVIYQMAYLRYVQLLIEFHPGIQELRKARRDGKTVFAWAHKGTGSIRQGVAGALKFADVIFERLLRMRRSADPAAHREYVSLRSAIQFARQTLQRRLPEIKGIREELADKVREMIAPYHHLEAPPHPFYPPRAA